MKPVLLKKKIKKKKKKKKDYADRNIPETSQTACKNINITVNNQALESVTSVVVDQNLIWKGHVDKVHRTVSMLLSKFWHIIPFRPTDAHIEYCQAFIFPHLDYCSTVWGSTQLQKLYKLQKEQLEWFLTSPPKHPPTPF